MILQFGLMLSMAVTGYDCANIRNFDIYQLRVIQKLDNNSFEAIQLYPPYRHPIHHIIKARNGEIKGTGILRVPGLRFIKNTWVKMQNGFDSQAKVWEVCKPL